MAMRIEGKCIGDCSKCQLLANGEVDMIPCVLDQIFNRVQRNERELAAIHEIISSQKSMKEEILLAGLNEETQDTEAELSND